MSDRTGDPFAGIARTFSSAKPGEIPEEAFRETAA